MVDRPEHASSGDRRCELAIDAFYRADPRDGILWLRSRFELSDELAASPRPLGVRFAGLATCEPLLGRLAARALRSGRRDAPRRGAGSDRLDRRRPGAPGDGRIPPPGAALLPPTIAVSGRPAASGISPSPTSPS